MDSERGACEATGNQWPPLARLSASTRFSCSSTCAVRSEINICRNVTNRGKAEDSSFYLGLWLLT